jgi:hypothetical protein
MRLAVLIEREAERGMHRRRVCAGDNELNVPRAITGTEQSIAVGVEMEMKSPAM